MANPEDIYRRGHALGGSAVEIMKQNGAGGLAAVFLKPHPFYPVFVGTPQNFGYGYESYQSYKNYLKLMADAARYATYASRTQGRSVLEQLKKLGDQMRDHAAYGVEFTGSDNPQYAHDKVSGLTVVVVSDDVQPSKTVEYAELAVKMANENQPTFTEAAIYIRTCLSKIERGLPPLGVGVALMALLQIDFGAKFKEPAIVCGMTLGRVMDPYNYPIVKAKARSTSLDGLPSGPAKGGITGAKTMEISQKIRRVVAAGGLPSGDDDIAAIDNAKESLMTLVPY